MDVSPLRLHTFNTGIVRIVIELFVLSFFVLATECHCAKAESANHVSKILYRSPALTSVSKQTQHACGSPVKLRL